MMPEGLGKQVLIEELRQICIYKYITNPNKENKDMRWWNYIINYYSSDCVIGD